ncbi:hypothetical protein [Oscillatoria sp. FACHB-1406]|uniref:hypothetical protein n=1 Tax=Oscillatoria sp. FACHB-1406 TaxID=2692846 RepID=UPI001686F25B|nr:hypothetical protein [Oscillatoria sp. FACHB-1406]MBD2577473.1 hypothetical protein [Oscillatoria sp. FACHB-1406]
MKIKWKYALGTALAIALFAEPALANAISTLYFIGTLYLLVGNAAIGLFEGRLLARFFGTQRSKSIGIAILANYVSAWLGVVPLISLASRFQDIPLESVKTLLRVSFLLAFILTVLIEYPFIWLLFRDRPNSFWQAAKANLIIQSLSYLIIYFFFLPYSPTSLATNLQFVPFSELQPTGNYALYFISPDKKQVMRSRLDGKPPEFIKDISHLNFSYRPYFCSHQTAQKTFDLFLESYNVQHKILSDFATRTPTWISEKEIDCRMPWGPVASLSDRDIIQEGYHNTFEEGGIRGSASPGKPKFKYSLKTPIIQRRMSSATQLKDERVVLQIGEDRIYILHPYQKKIAEVVEGSSPLVVIPK